MNQTTFCFFRILILLSWVMYNTPDALGAPKETHPQIWYTQPAEQWMESIPIGNGRIGAMIYGGITGETIAINESTVWAGEKDTLQNPIFGRKNLNVLRQIFFDGDMIKGNQIAADKLRGTFRSFGTHLPVGDLKIRFTHPEGKINHYKRTLDMEQGICTVSYQVGKTSYRREYFSSNPDDVLVFHFSANKRKSINAEISLQLLREAEISVRKETIAFKGQVNFPKQGTGGVKFLGNVKILTNHGTVQHNENSLNIQNADELTIIVDLRTNYKNHNYEQLCSSSIEKAAKKSYEEVKEKHIKDFSHLFGRVTLTLGKQDAYQELPTDKKWEAAKSGKCDPSLDALFFQYGRYLLISASRENSPLPVALQGFFNDNLACNMSWTNDYHLDINTQQNYWIANIGNLAECNIPLFNYIHDLSISGSQTARTVYGCEGWTAHTLANVWGCTAPSTNIGWGLFPTAGSWLATHLWTQYEYVPDKQYLQDIAYPLLKGNAKFLLDYMTEDPQSGYLMTGPSISPENNFKYQGHTICASMMPTCDRVLVYEILNSCLQATNILGIDKDFQDSLRHALKKLPPIRLSRKGGIREWYEDYEESSPNHRHTSHLLALYPFNQISLEKTPSLSEGAFKTISDRLNAPHWEDTEWSRANLICYYARLKDAANAYQSIKILEGKLSGENLLTVSPAGIAGAENDIFAFDGNSAGAAGIGEMLIQGHEGYIEFLPCLPTEWAEGYYKGLCVKGGGEVSVKWKQHKIEYASIKAIYDNTFKVKIPTGRKYKIKLNGQTIPNSSHQRILTLKMNVNDLMEIE